MKKVLMVLVVALLTGSMAMAQNSSRSDRSTDPKERAERMTERMTKEYSLNDTQKKQVHEANLALMEKMGDMPMNRRPDMRGAQKDNKVKKGEKKQMTDTERQEKKAEMGKKMEELKVARDAYDAQLKKIMTTEQYDAYSKKQAERRTHAQRKG